MTNNVTFSIFRSCFDLIFGHVSSWRCRRIQNILNLTAPLVFSFRITYPGEIIEEQLWLMTNNVTFSIFRSCFDLIFGLVTSWRSPRILNILNLVPQLVFLSRKTYTGEISGKQLWFMTNNVIFRFSGVVLTAFWGLWRHKGVVELKLLYIWRHQRTSRPGKLPQP